MGLLLAGDSGTGKSTNLLWWPKPFILDLEGSLKGSKGYHTERLGRTPDFKWGTPLLDANDRPVPEQDQFKRCEQLLAEAVASPEVATICIDGLGRLYDMLKLELSYAAGEKPVIVAGQRVMGLAQWGVYPDKLKRFIWNLRAKGKPVILTAHLKVDENEMTSVKEYRIADLQTDFGKSNSLPKCFSDYFQTINEPCAKDKEHPRGVRYKLRTAPTIRNVSLKTSFMNLPDEFEVGGEEFKKLMERVAATTVPVAPTPAAAQPISSSTNAAGAVTA